MKIFNLMFGKKLGGLEQAAFDYACALSYLGCDVITFLDPKSEMLERFQQHNLQTNTSIRSVLGGFDLIAKAKLHREIKRAHPDFCITHGRRAATFAAKNGTCPVLGVTHSFNISPLQDLEGLLAINQSMKQRAQDLGFEESKIQVVHNMLPQKTVTPRALPNHTPPKIGAMARLVHRKGLHVFIDALDLLQRKGVEFQAEIAGMGEEHQTLENQINQSGLSTKVQLIGWADASSFYQSLDIFCIPSLEEPFGLVILEAWLHGVPLISSNASGPAEIIQNDKNGILVPAHDSESLALAIEALITDSKKRHHLQQAGYEILEKQYLLPAGARRLQTALEFFKRSL